MEEKGMSVGECIGKARAYIVEKGMCLLLFDVKGSKRFDDCCSLVERLKDMMQDLNSRFEEYFPENALATPTRTEKGFKILLGDGSWAGINSAEIILEVVDYQKRNYPNISVYWSVARDGFDDEGIKIVK